MSPHKKHEFVDYNSSQTARYKMANYLRTGNFKKIAGSPIIGRRVARRRIWLVVTASIIFLIGTLYAVF